MPFPQAANQYTPDPDVVYTDVNRRKRGVIRCGPV